MFDSIEEFQTEPCGLEWDLHRLYCGDVQHDSPLKIGDLPWEVVHGLGWPTGKIFAHRGFAQKVRFHEKHPVDFQLFRELAGMPQEAEIWREPERAENNRAILLIKRCEAGKVLKVPCYLDTKFGGRGIFARTMILGRISKRKWDSWECLYGRRH